MGELKRLETERHDFVKALHNIYNNEHIRPQQAEARKLADFIARARTMCTRRALLWPGRGQHAARFPAC